MPSFDVHQHLWPEPFVAALAARAEPPRVTERGRVLELLDGSYEIDLHAHALEARIGLLDRDAIDVAVVSLQPTLCADEHAELRAAYHEGILELVAAAGGRLAALACGECREGFAGACVSAAALVEGVDDSLLDELEHAGQILFVHPGPAAPAPVGAPAWWPAVVDYTAQMQAAYAAWLARGVRAHPGLPVVFALLAGGAPFQLERLRSRGVELRSALHRSVYLETASYGRRALELCLATYGVGQLLYGSDTPVIDSRPTLQALAEFGEAVVESVCSENPSRLLT